LQQFVQLLRNLRTYQWVMLLKANLLVEYNNGIGGRLPHMASGLV